MDKQMNGLSCIRGTIQHAVALCESYVLEKAANADPRCRNLRTYGKMELEEARTKDT